MSTKQASSIAPNTNDTATVYTVAQTQGNDGTDYPGQITSHTNTLMGDLNYYMSHPRRGHAYIFNHVKFKPSLNLKERKGSNSDLEGMRKVLTSLDFDVKCYVDQSREELFKIINELSKMDHSDCDCVLIAVFTHGNRGLLHANDDSYSPKYLWESFLPDRCPSLAGKPKIFIIQACRGARVDSGTTLKAFTPSANKNHPVRTETDAVTVCAAQTISLAYTIPAHADILIACSTLPGFVSYRNNLQPNDFLTFKFLEAILLVPRNLFRLPGWMRIRRNGDESLDNADSSPQSGSWFIRTLNEVLEKLSDTEDLLSMLTITSCRVATRFETSMCDDFLKLNKQIPCFNSTFTRKLYFTPKQSVRKPETSRNFLKYFRIMSVQFFLWMTLRRGMLKTFYFVAPAVFGYIMYGAFVDNST